jgi:hypothetical protein
MKKGSLLILLAALVMLTLPLPAAHAEDQVVLRTEQDRDNYRTGVEFVKELEKKGGTINLNLVIKGMQDELAGNTAPLSSDETPAVSAPGPAEYAAAPAAGPSTASSAAGQTEHQAVRIPGETTAPKAAVAVAQRQSGFATPERMRAPSGLLLSQRNQAKLNVDQLKREMRAQALAGGL